MKIFSLSQSNSINRPNYRKTIAFSGDPNEQFLANKQGLLKAKSTFERIMIEFSDRINLEKEGEQVKIPNCLMLVSEDKDAEAISIEWLKKKSRCNFVYVSGKNNDELQEILWAEINKSKEIFERAKQRTLIHVKDFDQLITPGKNSFENIESIKGIMSSLANDYGVTIVFSTKDPTKLTSEAIQPHRVTRLIISGSKDDYTQYNVFLEKRGAFIERPNKISPPPKDIAVKPPIKTPEGPKQAPKIPCPPKLPPVKKIVSSKEEIPIKRVVTPLPEVVPPPKTDFVDNTSKEISKGSRAFKIVGILVAIGAVVAGIAYYLKNYNKPKSPPTNSKDFIKGKNI